MVEESRSFRKTRTGIVTSDSREKTVTVSIEIQFPHPKYKKIVKIGEKFFKLNKKEKIKLSPNKWNKKNKNFYRGYFPSDVNGKEGLDIGDLRVSENFSQKIKNQYIECLDLEKCFQKN